MLLLPLGRNTSRQLKRNLEAYQRSKDKKKHLKLVAQSAYDMEMKPRELTEHLLDSDREDLIAAYYVTGVLATLDAYNADVLVGKGGRN